MAGVAAALAGAACPACADAQGALFSSTTSHFTPGMTTRAQAVAALGTPSAVYEAADGDMTLTWARDGGLFNADETRHLSIVFGPDDKMIRIMPQPRP